jgi:hypothetical protein
MGFAEAIRISVGTAEENDKCLAAMERVLKSDEADGVKRGRAEARPYNAPNSAPVQR